jgi:hypothetical protein
VDGRGTLCMFEEEQVDAVESVDSATYHTLRSVYNKRWYLGAANSRAAAAAELRMRQTAVGSGGGRYSAARRLLRPAPDFCGAHFRSGRHGPPAPAPQAFYGVFDLVSDFMDGNSRGNNVPDDRVNLKNSLAANSDSSSSSSSSSSYSNREATTWSSLRGESNDSDSSNSDGGDPSGAAAVDNPKISVAHLEALRMQRHRIRHVKHKRPRPSRQEKMRAKQERLQQLQTQLLGGGPAACLLLVCYLYHHCTSVKTKFARKTKCERKTMKN